MPKIKPSTLFNKWTLPIVLIDDSPKDSLIKASMLIQPIVDELTKQLPKVDPKVAHVENTGNAVFNALNAADTLLSITEPTIISIPGTCAAADHSAWSSFNKERKVISCGAIAATSAPLNAYVKFLVAAGGGFIIHVTSAENMQNLNPALPIIQFDPNKNSYLDIEYKVSTILKKIISDDNISHHITIQSVANNPWPHNKLALCLGSWNRVLWDDSTEELKNIVNVAGIPGSPITIEEFTHKVWCGSKLSPSELNPMNTLVVRNPSIESKLVLAKVLTDKVDPKKLNFIEV